MIKRKFLAFVVASFFIVLSSFPASAATEYTVNVVDETFSSYTNFLAPGDVDGNGTLANNDVLLLKAHLLGEADYGDKTDVNGDSYIDIRDLVRQQKNFVGENFLDLEDGAINLNGKSIINGDQLSKVGPGAKYSIKCSSDSAIKVVISGIWEEDRTFNFSAASNPQVVTTPKTISEPSNAKIALIGTGTVTEVKLTRIDMDNELSARSINQK